MKQAEVYRNKILAGILTQHDNRTYSFRYIDDYFNDDSLAPVSLTLPKIKKEYRSEYLFAFFFNMLSEGTNRKLQCRHLQIDEQDHFSLLLNTAGFDTPGAVTIKQVKNDD